MYTLYRVEDSEFYGPYRSELIINDEDMRDHHCRSDDHPGMIEDWGTPEFIVDNFKEYEDQLLEEISNYKNAFTTLELLKIWFTGYLGSLEETGYNIVKLEVKEYRESQSGKQAFFKEEDVITRETINTEFTKQIPQL